MDKYVYTMLGVFSCSLSYILNEGNFGYEKETEGTFYSKFSP